MAFDIKKPGGNTSKFASMRAAAASASTNTNSTGTELSTKLRFLDPSECPERIRLIFDDSGSMGGSPLENAKKGVVEFLRSCTPNQVAVAIHLLSFQGDSYSRNIRAADCLQKAELMSDLIQLASSIDSPDVTAPGSTPLYETLLSALRATPRATRYIAFSDGSPDNTKDKREVISLSLEAKTPIDTVFIGRGSGGAEELRSLAAATGGIFLDFSRGDVSTIRSSLKYLAPSNRLLLVDDSFRAAVERGEK
jgi:uncharacterized protein YegL